MSWSRWLELARDEVARTLAELPADLRTPAAALPVRYERAPDPAADEVESDTLGLFVGGEFADEKYALIPAHIILYLDNIRDMVEEDEEEFCDEVRITFIHELGHYLGLDEDELEERGLL